MSLTGYCKCAWINLSSFFKKLSCIIIENIFPPPPPSTPSFTDDIYRYFQNYLYVLPSKNIKEMALLPYNNTNSKTCHSTYFCSLQIIIDIERCLPDM